MLAENLASVATTEDLHAWEAGGAASTEALAVWVSARLAAHEEALAALLAVEGERTPENSLRLYDAAIEQLSLAGAQAGVLNSVAADKAVRDQAQIEAQRVAMARSKGPILQSARRPGITLSAPSSVTGLPA
jgi:thimet oligopeptidase